MKKPSLVFIGGSLQSAVGYTHYLACQESWNLKAGCYSTSENINEMTAQKYGTRYHTSWRMMLDIEKPDAVVVLTPTPSHAKIILPLLDYNIPIICEKALAESSQDIRKIIMKCDNLDKFAVTYNYSGYPMVRQLKKLIVGGRIGQPLHFQVEMPQEAYIRFNSSPQGWRLKDGNVPMIHLDLFSHLHHLLHYLLRRTPLEVVAKQNSYGNFDVIDNVGCLCRYSDNVDGQIWFSKSAVGHRNGLRLRIYGSKGSAEWYQMNPEELIIRTNFGTQEIIDRSSLYWEASIEKRYDRFKAGHPAGFIEAFANLYNDIAVKFSGVGNDDEVFGPTLALEGLCMMEAMRRSAETKKWEMV